MRNDRENIIVAKTFDFALEIIDFSEVFFNMNRFSLANQIFKAGTAIGANVREAQNAESKSDFIHKMKIIILYNSVPLHCLPYYSWCFK